MQKRPDLSNGGLRLPFTADGPLPFVPRKDFSACTAGTLGYARDDSLSDPREIIMKLHVNRRDAYAHQLKRVLTDSGGGNSHSAKCVGEVLERCETCRAFDTAPDCVSVK